MEATATPDYTLTGGKFRVPEFRSQMPPSITSYNQKCLNDKDRKDIHGLLAQFYKDGVSWSTDEPARISTDSFFCSSMFIDHLPTNTYLPKISPDGENGLVATWQIEGQLILLTIDDYNLYFSTNVGTRNSRTKSFRFDGEAIPREILTAIRRK